MSENGDATSVKSDSEEKATVNVRLNVGKKRKRDIEVAADLLADIAAMKQAITLFAEVGSRPTCEDLAKQIIKEAIPERAETAARELIERMSRGV